MSSHSAAEIARRLIDSFDTTRNLLSTDVVFELWRMGNELKLQDPARSLEIAEVAMAAAAHIAEPRATALAQWAKGTALLYLYHPADSLVHYRLAKRLFIQLNLPLETTQIQTPMIYALNAIGDPDAALALADKARQSTVSLGDEGLKLLANIEMNVGIIHRQQGQFDAALAACDRATQAFESVKDNVGIARININRANVFRQMDDLANVEVAYLEARIVLETSQSHAQDLALVDENLGELAIQLGQYQLGLQRLEDAHSGYQSEIRRATVNLKRAAVYTRLNLGREAISLANAAYEIFVTNSLQGLRAYALTVLFNGYRQLGNREEAEVMGLNAVRCYRDLAQQYHTAESELALAKLYLDENRLDEARQLADHVQRVSDPALWPALAAGSCLLLARIALQAKSESKAPHSRSCQQMVDQALSITRRFTLPAETIEAYHLQAQLFTQQGDDAAAWEAFQQALAIVNGLRMNLLLDEFQIGFMDQYLPIYIDALNLLSNQLAGDDPLTELTMLARMVTLLNTIGTLPTTSQQPELDSALKEADAHALWAELRRLRREWLWRQEKETTILVESDSVAVDEADEPSTVQSLNEVRAERVDLEGQMTDIWRRLGVQQTVGSMVDATENITAGNFTVRNRAHDLPELGDPDEEAEELLWTIHDQLNDSSALLHYFLLSDQICVLILRDDHASLVRLGAVAAVDRALRVWRHHLHDLALIVDSPKVANQSVKRPLALLHRLLVEPLLAGLKGVDHLYLVLPPIWHELPFSAFWGATGNKGNGANDGYLIERFQLTRLSYPEALIGHNTKRDDPVANVDKPAQTMVLGYSSHGALPQNVKEAQQIGAILGASTTCRLYIEEQASADLFFTIAPDCRLIHLATHALFRPESPLFSSLELADHLLTVAEIYHSVRFKHQPLVIFSACETGRGVAHDGGLLGMARALIGAGAGDLILTLWPVDDTQSENLMARFYDHIFPQNSSPNDSSINESTTSMTHSLALHQAQLALAKTLHPFFWAGFIYIGG